jgi:hypothetical protein
LVCSIFNYRALGPGTLVFFFMNILVKVPLYVRVFFKKEYHNHNFWKHVAFVIIRFFLCPAPALFCPWKKIYKDIYYVKK